MSDISLNGFASSAQAVQHRRASSKLERELGPVIRACIGDPSVIEIMLNPDGRLREEKAALAEGIREVYSKAQSSGFDAKAVRQIIRIRELPLTLTAAFWATELLYPSRNFHRA